MEATKANSANKDHPVVSIQDHVNAVKISPRNEESKRPTRPAPIEEEEEEKLR